MGLAVVATVVTGADYAIRAVRRAARRTAGPADGRDRAGRRPPAELIALLTARRQSSRWPSR